MSVMRKKIAEHMVMSKRTSAHVHGVFEVDMTRIVKLREKMKAKFEQATGNKLTFTPFFARAVVHGIRKWPIINSSVEGENIRYHASINLGIAVALDWGLIVPVVKSAEERSFVGLQRAITDLGERARTKKLKPDEVQGGTFTITNPGSLWREIRDAHHQSAAGGHHGCGWNREKAGGGYRPGWQRLHRHPFHDAPQHRL